MKDIDRQIFDTAFALWGESSQRTATRERLKRFTYGDQWSDVVRHPDGRYITESDWILSTGRRPITNNLIRRLIKVIVGRYRDMAVNSGWYDDAPGSDAARLSLEEMDSRLLEEFLISGMAIQRVADDCPFSGGAGNVVNVVPDRFFCNDFRDPRGWDIEVAGMLHDMSPAEILMRFGRDNPDAKRRLGELIGAESVYPPGASATSAGFYTPARGRIRIIEVWTHEYNGRGNLKWRCRWYSASGTLLDSYVSPWKHGSHPFAVKFYPLTDGEIHSFVEDIVDQQKYINRIIVMIDRIMATTAKGVLLFPTYKDLTERERQNVVNQWSKPDGVIFLPDRQMEMPRQVGGMSGDPGAYRLLETELRLFEQTSGVGAAILGTSNDSSGFKGAEHYQAQVENATIALADIFRTFRALIQERDTKLQKL